MGTKRLSLGTNRLGTKEPWVRNDWQPYSVSKLVGAENFANPAKVRLDGITKTYFRPIWPICASDTK